jgi:hypothetical protein
MSDASKALTARIHDLMRDGTDRTAYDVAALFGARPKFARSVLNRLVDAGQVHVCGHVGGHHIKVFRYGPGVNAVAPVDQTPTAVRNRTRIAERCADRRAIRKVAKDGDLSEAEIDRLYRRSAEWWPKADAVLCGAFDSMIRTGGLAHG